ncbi:MAG: phosphatidylserine decarboxylase, partial [Planctomycetota bacterium]|nr:phosphatidylserine decarboxylase [Planctomycetota bacterium]
ACSVLLAAAMAVIALLVAWVGWWLSPLWLPPAAVWAWVIWFFRDPERTGPAGEGLFLSPADGRVADITPVGADSELGCEGVKVGVFMNIFSVHVNRSPFAGRVTAVTHRKGAFLDARDPTASERNESATVKMTCTLGGVEFPIVFRQVAGLLARRIVTDIAPGDALQRGQRFGMIKFGSRMELFVPRNLAASVPVTIGQKVCAGLTVLVRAPGETA